MPAAAQARARNYAVLWRQGRGPVRTGRLEFGPHSLRLEDGTARKRHSVSTVLYRDLVRVRTTSDPRERIQRRPTFILERRRGTTVAVAAIDPLVSVHELAEMLAGALTGTAAA
jgi:hypothetical protein